MTLLTRCTSCKENIFIDPALRAGQPFNCPQCGQRAYVWQLLGRANRETVVEDYTPTFPRAPCAVRRFAGLGGGMNDEKVEALVAAVIDLLHGASWYPADEYGAPEMIVDSQAVIACDMACNALIQEQAEAAHGVLRD